MGRELSGRHRCAQVVRCRSLVSNFVLSLDFVDIYTLAVLYHAQSFLAANPYNRVTLVFPLSLPRCQVIRYKMMHQA